MTRSHAPALITNTSGKKVGADFSGNRGDEIAREQQQQARDKRDGVGMAFGEERQERASGLDCDEEEPVVSIFHTKFAHYTCGGEECKGTAFDGLLAMMLIGPSQEGVWLRRRLSWIRRGRLALN